MKKIIAFCIAVLFITLSVEAQRASTTTVVPVNGWKNLTTTAADTITQGATVYWTFDVGLRKAYFYAISVGIDTVTHTTNRLATTVWGSMDNVNWVSSGITQVNVFPTAGGGADTTFVMSCVTTPQLWRYLKVRFISVDANAIGARLKSLGIKVADK